jgi:hypothetical protein
LLLLSVIHAWKMERRDEEPTNSFCRFDGIVGRPVAGDGLVAFTAPSRPRRTMTSANHRKGGVVMHGVDWLWMTLGMGFWVVLIGVAVYAAVRLAQRPSRERHV